MLLQTDAARSDRLQTLYRDVVETADSSYWASIEPHFGGYWKYTERGDCRDRRDETADNRQCAGHVVNPGTAMRGINSICDDARVEIATPVLSSILLARRMAATYGDGWTLDSSDCDVIIQVGLFGEIVYG